MHATRQHISTDQPLRCLDATNRHPHTPTACSGACLDGYTYNSKLQICVACEENERHIIDLFTPVFALGGASAAVTSPAANEQMAAAEPERPIRHARGTPRGVSTARDPKAARVLKAARLLRKMADLIICGQGLLP